MKKHLKPRTDPGDLKPRTDPGDDYPAKHFKIILIKSLIPDQANAQDTLIGVADYERDWAIVEAGVSQLDTYSHETGHSFNLASRAPPVGQKHEDSSVKAPNGGPPLMRERNATTRWIRQEDWILSNTEADNERYGK